MERQRCEFRDLDDTVLILIKLNNGEGRIPHTRIGSGNSVTPSDIITSVSQEFQEKREKRGAENLLNEGIIENIPNLGKETDT